MALFLRTILILCILSDGIRVAFPRLVKIVVNNKPFSLGKKQFLLFREKNNLRPEIVRQAHNNNIRIGRNDNNNFVISGINHKKKVFF